MTYEQLELPICLNANVTVLDFHARLSALLDTEEDLKIQEALYSLKSCGWLKSDSLKYFSLKMFQDYLTMRGGVTFGIIISTMAELGYSVEWQVLDSQNFGVPQHRERVFIVGHLGGGSGREVFPIRQDDSETTGIQRQQDTDRVVSNTLKSGERGPANGIYIATDRQTDRQTDRHSSRSADTTRMIEVNMVQETIKRKHVANTLDTKSGETKGFRTNYVIENGQRIKTD